MNDVRLSKDEPVRIRMRTNEASIAKVITFQDASGNPYDISGEGFEIPVYKSQNSTVKLFTLTIGDGLTVQGGNSQQLVIEVSQARATRKQDVHFHKLFSTVNGVSWWAGPWEFYDGAPAEITEVETVIIGDEEITIVLGDTVINRNVSGGSAASVYLSTQSINGGNA